MNIFRISTILLGLTAAPLAFAIPFGGVEFPGGAASFADEVVAYSPGLNVGANYNDPTDALGAPNYSAPTGSTSLGIGGSLTLKFTDNSLTTSGNTDKDLWIFEIGGAVEAFGVEISTDSLSWISLGSISGQPSGIDIDSFAGVTLGTFYSFVRLFDVTPDGLSGFPFGEADIDAVGAISSAPPVDVPEPGSLALLGLGVAGVFLRRKCGNAHPDK